MRKGVLFVALVSLLATVPVHAAETDDQRLRVFLDCQAFFACDFDLVRREIPWVDWVRNAEDSDVHLLVTFTAAGAGFVYDLQFLGLGRFEGDDSSLSHSSSSTDTSDELRRGLIERFKLGLVRYAGDTAAGELLRVEYDSPAEAPETTPENDPWNLWVFTVSAGGSVSTQSLTSATRLNGSLSASRTSERWKFRWGARSNYRTQDFELTDGTTTHSLTRSAGTDTLLVKSAGPLDLQQHRESTL